MEQQKYTRQQFASKIKDKYPAYAEMDDNTLVDKITAKYPQYLDQIEGGKANAVAEETATVAADQQSDLDLQSENGLSEQQEAPEVSKKTPVIVEEVSFFGENKKVDANELNWTDTFKIIKDPKTGDYGMHVPDFDLSFLKINDTEYNDDPETTSATESLARTWNNSLDQLSLTDDRFYNLSEQLFGDVESANFQTSKQAIDETESLQSETLRLEDIPTAFSEGGLVEGIAHTTAAITNAIASVGTSALQAAATKGAGMAIDMVQSSVSSYTKARAKELGVSYEEASGKISSSELIIPVGLGTLSYKLEKMGLKGVGKAINAMSDSGKKALIQYVNSAGKEALTELSQGLIESWSTGFGAKNSFDDAAKSVSKFIEEEALETALQGAVGGAGSVGVGRGFKKLRAKNRSSQNEKSIKNSVQTIFDIDKKLNNPSTTEEQKTILRKQKLVEKQKVKNILTNEDELVSKLTEAEQKALNEKEYMLNGRKLQNRNEIVEMIANATDEDFMKASITVFGDSDLQEKLNFRRKSIIKNNKNAVRKKVEPKTFEEAKSKVDEEIQKRKLQLSKISEEDGPLVAEALRTQIKKLEEAKKQMNNHINYQLDELNETELFELTELDDEISLYEAIANNPSYSEDAKASANAELERLKSQQQNKFNDTDSSDLANPEGPRKQKNVDLSRKTQEAFEKNDIDGIIKAQGGMISSVATSLWSRIPADKQVGTYDGFKAALISSKGGLLDLIGSYDPETGVPLAAWLGNKRTGLRVRANRIVKELTKQDIDVSTDSTEALNSFSSNEIDVDKINLGPKYNSQRLGLGVNLLDEAANNVELGTVAIEKALADADAKAEAKGKPLSQKQRQTVSEKAFNKFFKDQYAKRVKDKIGKKLDKENYIRDNVSILKKIALANRDFQKGNQGLAKDWNKYPPSDQAFIDYYIGTDTSNTQAISDRKKSLAEAVSAQIGKDAKDNYFEGKEAERAKIGEDLGISYQKDEEIQEQIDEITGKTAKMSSEEIYVQKTKPIFEQIAEKTGKDPKEVKKELSAARGQDRENSAKTKNFIEKVLPSFMNKGLMDYLKSTFTTSSSSRLQYASAPAYYESLALMEFINPESLTKEQKKALSKIKFRPAPVGKKLRATMTKEELAQKMVDDYTKLYNNIFSDPKSYKNKRDVQEKLLYDLLKGFEKSYSNDNAVEIGAVFSGQSESMGHFIRALAIPKVFANPESISIEDVVFNEKGIPKLIEEEHSFKAVLAANSMFNMVSNGTVDADFKDLMTLYFQTGLLVKDNDKLNAVYKDTMAPGTIFGDPLLTLRTYQEVGIDLSNYMSLINEVAERIGVTSDGLLKFLEVTEVVKDKTPDKIQSAIQKQEDSNPDPELSNAERQTALADILGAAFGVNIITTREDAIQALIDANEFPNTPEGRIKAGEALEKIRGFNVGEAIYISEKKATADTAMHELTHTWTRLVHNSKPELFDAIFEKLKSHPLYAEAVARMSTGSYAELSPESFGYKDEILAHILGKEGGDLFSLFKGNKDAKSLVQKFFDYVKETLGFDPATKNFADLTIDQVVKLAVKDITEGNPAANFNKLKNVAEGKSWYAKSEASVSPSAKAKADPILRALNKLKLSYRKNKNLAQAINDAYSEVEGIMDFLDFARLIAKNTKEITTGKTKQLLVAKAEVIKANKIAEESAKKQAEAKVSEDYATELQNKFRRLIYQAKGEGAKASRWFIPPNAEDFKGLLYTFLPKGEVGVAAKKWMTEVLLKPYSDAIAALDTEILNKSKAWAAMSKGFDFNQKVDGSPYTLGDAIKVYNALKEGKDPGIAKKKHLDALIHAVESNSEILDLANEIADSFPIDLKSGWQNRSFAKEIYDSINDGARKRHLETFSANVDAIFNDTTLDLIADQFGVKYKQALVSTLKRMKSGRNRTANDANANAYMNWLNRAVGTTMFLNTRSAVLQLLSTLNFIGKPGNNLFQATAAFANRKQWNEDYKKLWDSDYLTNRRDGAKFDVLADEIANDPDNWISKILQKGFLPTRYADSFAIALGGASFYRNRVNSLVKEGMSEADAEVQAMKDWRQAAEESQQSSDPSKISEIQASSIGKIIYAFANTPFQYARITKRKLQDLTSGRSAAEGNVKKDLGTIFYYSTAQALIFNALQSGLVALLMSDDDDDELKEEKYASMLERSLTSFAKSTGNPGAVASTLYAMMKEGYLQQTGKKRPDANAFAVTATSISPPLNSKLRDIAGAYRAYNKIEDGDAFTPSLDNEALTMAGEVASVAGLPLDRVIRKARHLAAISNEEAELWQKIWMLAGWSEWELGVDKPNVGVKKPKIKKVKITKPKLVKPKLKKSPTKKLERGVAGRANNDGTIEIDPNLSPVEREKTIAHEEQHMKDMKAGKLNYDDDYVYWNGGKYERKNGKIKYKGKSYIEGHKDLPWEKKAYAAEPSTAEAKKRTKLYA